MERYKIVWLPLAVLLLFMSLLLEDASSLNIKEDSGKKNNLSEVKDINNSFSKMYYDYQNNTNYRISTLLIEKERNLRIFNDTTDFKNILASIN